MRDTIIDRQRPGVYYGHEYNKRIAEKTPHALDGEGWFNHTGESKNAV